MSQPSYFVEHRRGEVTELQTMLRNPKLSPERKRGVVERVIAYMTLGIDVSKLFTDMIMATHSKDLVQKKLVYLYLATYAEQKPELALLAINTLQKDCRDDDPMVRGLALRSLCSLRVGQLMEYVMLPIRKGLNDPSSYVRKAAVVGCAKLFAISPGAVKESDLVDILYNLLKDRDSSVVSNVINSLNDILNDEGGMAINNSIVRHLLNRIRDFHEWAQCTVLDLIAKYKPESEQEMYDIMNLLEERLKHSNSAVVLGTAKVFLSFTSRLPMVQQEVFLRIKAPLLTLIGGSNYHIAYPVLSHVKIIVSRHAGIFDDEYKSFFLRHNEPSCVKLLRLDILARVSSPRNASAILNELSEYVTDSDADIARKSIRIIGELAIKVEQVTDESIEHLLSFLDLNIDCVSTEACVVIKDLLRKYPERNEYILPVIHKVLRLVHGEQGKVAVVWMLGEYGEVISDAPYLLEDFIDSYEEERSCLVRSELLSATVKLFMKRPPEMQAMLGRLLSTAISDLDQEVYVRDRALFYYRLLKTDVQMANMIINCPKTAVEEFIEQHEDSVVDDKLFIDFNSLSVVYGYCISGGTTIEKGPRPTQEKPGHVDADPVRVVSPPSVEAIIPDLLSFDINVSPVKVTPFLSPNPVCDATLFQQQWALLPISSTINQTLSDNPSNIEPIFNKNMVFTIAAGVLDQKLKMYFFAQRASSNVLGFIEIVIDLPSRSMCASFKSPDAQFASQLASSVDQWLQPLQAS